MKKCFFNVILLAVCCNLDNHSQYKRSKVKCLFFPCGIRTTSPGQLTHKATRLLFGTARPIWGQSPDL